MVSNYVKETARQLRVGSPTFRGLNSKLIAMDDYTLRVHSPRHHTNVDVRYNRGTDLYDIKAHKIKGVEAVKVHEGTGYYSDNLEDVFQSIFKRRR